MGWQPVALHHLLCPPTPFLMVSLSRVVFSGITMQEYAAAWTAYKCHLTLAETGDPPAAALAGSLKASLLLSSVWVMDCFCKQSVSPKSLVPLPWSCVKEIHLCLQLVKAQHFWVAAGICMGAKGKWICFLTCCCWTSVRSFSP